MRRSQIKARKPSLTSDELTGETHIRHKISPQGFYRGKQVMTIKQKETIEEDQE